MINSSQIEEILIDPEESQCLYGGNHENPEEEKNCLRSDFGIHFCKNSGCNHNRKFSIVLKGVH